MKYSARIYATRPGFEGEIGVTHINDAFKTKRGAHLWLGGQLPSFEYLRESGYTLYGEIYPEQMYTVELANKTEHGRVVGNLYVVTQRPIGNSAIVAEFDTREEAQAWINRH